MRVVHGVWSAGLLAAGAGLAVVVSPAVGPAAASAGPAGARPARSAGLVVHQPNRPMRRVGSTAGTRELGWSSFNWSGYAETAKAPYRSAVGEWVVPSVARSAGATYSSQWVGIDGFTNSHLIQTGTEADYRGGAAHYDAWWEILPAAATVIPSLTIHPGNHMKATIVHRSGSSWKITITDRTTGHSFSTTRTYKGPGASAEWIEERPEVNGSLATLAHYKSPDTFDNGLVKGANPKLVAKDGGGMFNNAGTVRISTPSVPDSDTNGFNVAYGSKAPAPPKS